MTVGAFAPPVRGKAGSLQADVIVTNPTPPASQAPEPASLLLAALGGSAVGLRAWWRRRGAPG